MARRPAIPEKTKQKVLYESAFACAVCAEKGDHIHHIDKKNTNNTFDNLILLCQTHHNEAHTQRELSLNLTPDRLLDYRSTWYETVRAKRLEAASVSGQRASAQEILRLGVTWGYINHSRLLQTAPKTLLDMVDQPLLDRLRRTKIVDERGILIKPDNIKHSGTYINNTVYDWYSHSDSIALHIFYSDLVDRFVEIVQPIHLDEKTWTRTFIKHAISTGNFIFINRAQYFKMNHKSNENAEISVQAFARKIKIFYSINTRNMYGTTSITNSFSGHKSCASLLQLKSVEEDGAERILHCTPIALGVGFRRE